MYRVHPLYHIILKKHEDYHVSRKNVIYEFPTICKAMRTCCNKWDIQNFWTHSFLLHSHRSCVWGPISASTFPLSRSKGHFISSMITKPITDYPISGGCSYNTIYSLVTRHQNCHCFYLQHQLKIRQNIIFTVVFQCLAQCLTHMNLKYLVNGWMLHIKCEVGGKKIS